MDNKDVHNDETDLKDMINDYGSDDELRRRIVEMKKEKEAQAMHSFVQEEPVEKEVKKESSMPNITVDDDLEKTKMNIMDGDAEKTLVIMNGKKEMPVTETKDEEELGKTIVRPLHEVEEEVDFVEEVDEDENEDEEDDENEEVNRENDDKKDEKKNKIITIVIIVVLVLLLIGGIVLGVFAFKGSDSDKPKPEHVTEQDKPKPEVEKPSTDTEDEEIKDNSGKISALSKQKETYIENRGKAETRKETAEEELEEAESEKEALDADLLVRSKDANKVLNDYLNGEYKQANDDYNAKEKEYKDATEENKAGLEEGLQAAKERKEAAVAEFNRLSSEASSLTTEYHEKNSAIEKRIKNAKAEIEEQENTISSLTKKINDINAELEELS